MTRGRSFVACCAALLCHLLASPDSARAFQLSDLQGIWELSSIASGPGAPWWERARATIALDGSFTAFANDNTGGLDTLQGQASLSSVGIITLGDQGVFRGALDKGTTVFAGTDTWSGYGAGTTELKLGVKMAPSYVLADLAGDWELNIIASGPGAPWWERGRITVAPNGNLTGSFVDNSGQTDPVSGSMNLSPAGIVTFPAFANSRGAMDAHKTVLVMTNTWTGFAAGTAEFTVGVKMAAAYTLADLVGTWEIHSLATGPGAPHWTRSHVTIFADGSFVSSSSESNGVPGSSSGTVGISPSGVITRSGLPSARGVLDAGKSVMVWTDIWSTQSPGTTEIEVAVKTTNATLDVPMAGGVGLAIDPVRPNPIRTGALTVHFVLPNATPAQIELFEVSGRRIMSREVGSLGAGRHAISLLAGGRLSPGLYLVRLRQGLDDRVARVFVLE